jgi:hypothetical protein
MPVRPNWNTVVRPLVTNLNIQICPEPPMRRDSPISGKIFAALRDLKADYNRYQPWFPYPRLTVAQLERPSNGRTYWDFTHLDPLMIDTMKAIDGSPVVMNIGPLPIWMFKLDKPVPLPDDPNKIVWDYAKGTELVDPTMTEAAEYFRRMAEWYIKGGFTDEFGKRHESGHRFRFGFWEVLNEVDLEHQMSPEFYTAMYDKIVEAVRPVDPSMKFSGPALANVGERIDMLDYFLDPKNHKPGIPVDAISYHFYANPSWDDTPETMQHVFFAQADRMIHLSRHIDNLRRRVRPGTEMHFNEIGSTLPDPMSALTKPIPNDYWNLSGALFAYMYMHLAQIGVEVASAAELIDYPGQFASTTLLDWNTGQPNARYWVLQMLHDSFKLGDSVIDTPGIGAHATAQAFRSKDGTRKVLLINKRNRPCAMNIQGAKGGTVEVVDEATGFQPARKAKLDADDVRLAPYGVAVVTLPFSK